MSKTPEVTSKKVEYAMLNVMFGVGYAFNGEWKRTLIVFGIIVVAAILAGVTMTFSKFIPSALYFGILGLLGYSAYDGFKKGL